jgi:hypothetical protein
MCATLFPPLSQLHPTHRHSMFRRYEQIGLKFKLYSAEVLFNKGLCKIYLGRLQEGLMDMQDARRDAVTEEHGVIDDAIRDRGDRYTVFSIVRFLLVEVGTILTCITTKPVGVLFRPSENKLKNSKAKDYMGTAVCSVHLRLLIRQTQLYPPRNS